MPKKTTINVKCPCCDVILEVDVEKERVTSHRRGRHLAEDARDGEDEFSVAMRNQREARERAERKFLKAQKSIGKPGSSLDDLFRDSSGEPPAKRDD